MKNRVKNYVGRSKIENLDELLKDITSTEVQGELRKKVLANPKLTKLIELATKKYTARLLREMREKT
ncbi:MAG: hypothetical protein A3I73_00880 [Omnitrophica bacterium RIFCSPLOWO2_02_FULL_45_16]|nr:MAG: hypothetical protein A3C51_04310 [Omnitrophica bacterium RIFCSPHIGHO2_02_FULL_46_20]OGX00759.1 MAG: hypothetical protein A3I73_00880 [Omnitrophica bacterium RIFCSPLOWO2_02_FULL_45_16]